MVRLVSCVRACLRPALRLAMAVCMGASWPACAQAQARAEALTPIERLERDGIANPRQAAQEAATLAAAEGRGTPAWMRALRLQGQLLARAGDTAGAAVAADQLEAAAQPAAPPSAEARAGALLIRARIQRRDGALGQAERLLTDARQKLPAQATGLLAFELALLQAQVKEERGATDEAVRLYLQALELATPLGTPWRRADVLRQLAWLTAETGQLDRAASLNSEALAIAQAEGRPLALTTIYNTEGFILGRRGDRAGELRATRLALEQARAAGSRKDEALMLANMADIHLKGGEYLLAQQVSNQALAIAHAQGDRDIEAVALGNRGLALVSLKRGDEGKRDLAAALAIDEARGSLTGMASTQEEAARYLERAGDLPGALEAWLRWRPLADRLYRQEQQKAVLELQEGFDHAERSRALSLLEADGALQRERLRTQTLRLWAWLLGAALLGIALLLVLLLARRVRRSNVELAELNQQLEVQSVRDPLTGLANRRRFLEAMREQAADGHLTGSLLLIDVDHFKQLNDRHGHAAGDAVLVQLAQRLQASVRANDLVVRWGGEEFLVVAGNDMAADDVEALAQRLLDAVGGSAFEHEGRPLAVSVSVGWASFPVQPTQLPVPWSKAVDLVDTALYLAKAHGRNRAYGVRALQATHESELVAIASSLEEAWRAGQVVLTLLTGPAPREAAA